MTDIKAMMTEQGLQRALKAAIEGESDIGLSYIVLGEGKYTPNPKATTLLDGKLKIEDFEIEFEGPNQAVVTCRADDSIEVAVSEVGLFFEDDTLFALWADKQPLFFKGPHERVRYRFFITLNDAELVIPRTDSEFEPEQEDEDYSLILAQLNMGIAQIKNARENANKPTVVKL